MMLPDLAELLGFQLPARSLDLRAHRPALAHLQGARRSAQRGRGLEFDEVRPYAPGDDAHRIDWRVTARRGKAHTKLFREERERPVWLVADLHANLFFGSRRQLKSALLLRAAALLGWAAIHGGDRLGAVVATPAGAVHALPPRTREAALLPLLGLLVTAQPQRPAPWVPTLTFALQQLCSLIKPGSLVLVLSDFSQLDSDSSDLLGMICQRAECRLLVLDDPLEQQGLPAGQHRVGLPRRASWWLDGSRSQSAWRAAFAERQQQLSALATNYQLPLHTLSTADDVAERLVALLRDPAWAA